MEKQSSSNDNVLSIILDALIDPGNDKGMNFQAIASYVHRKRPTVALVPKSKTNENVKLALLKGVKKGLISGTRGVYHTQLLKRPATTNMPNSSYAKCQNCGKCYLQKSRKLAKNCRFKKKRTSSNRQSKRVAKHDSKRKAKRNSVSKNKVKKPKARTGSKGKKTRGKASAASRGKGQGCKSKKRKACSRTKRKTIPRSKPFSLRRRRSLLLIKRRRGSSPSSFPPPQDQQPSEESSHQSDSNTSKFTFK